MRHPFLALAIVGSLGAQSPAPSADPFTAVRFLEGEWKGEGGGLPGQSTGAATFRFELGERPSCAAAMLIRRRRRTARPRTTKT